MKHTDSRPLEDRSGTNQRDDSDGDSDGGAVPGEQSELSRFCSPQRASSDAVTTRRDGTGSGDAGGDDVDGDEDGVGDDDGGAVTDGGASA